MVATTCRAISQSDLAERTCLADSLSRYPCRIYLAVAANESALCYRAWLALSSIKAVESMPRLCAGRVDRVALAVLRWLCCAGCVALAVLGRSRSVARVECAPEYRVAAEESWARNKPRKKHRSRRIDHSHCGVSFFRALAQLAPVARHRLESAMPNPR